jgi:hypothetical protein
MRCQNWIVFEDIRTVQVIVFHFIPNCRAVYLHAGIDGTNSWEAEHPDVSYPMGQAINLSNGVAEQLIESLLVSSQIPYPF